MDSSSSTTTQTPPFLPNLCTLQAVFLLVVLGELLALALTLADVRLSHFDWQGLGLRSFLIQWIALLSAALICPLRPWLSLQKPSRAGLLSYCLVLAVAAMCSIVGLWLLDGWQIDDLWGLLSNLVLTGIFAGVVLRYLYVQQQLSNQQKAELSARIQVLQSRIQPHFLFNSMNSIASLIVSAPDKAERMVEDLAVLFRASLAEPGLVSLEDELELCHHYIAIEQIRLGPRLSVSWRVADQLRLHPERYQIPSLLLQPLLENAVQHGIQPRSEGGNIDIEVKLVGNVLVIIVVNPASSEPSTHNGNQMALENIRHRLQAYFGPEATFKAEAAGSTFVANISYPVS